jgi:hypothetical protein
MEKRNQICLRLFPKNAHIHIIVVVSTLSLIVFVVRCVAVVAKSVVLLYGGVKRKRIRKQKREHMETLTSNKSNSGIKDSLPLSIAKSFTTLNFTSLPTLAFERVRRVYGGSTTLAPTTTPKDSTQPLPILAPDFTMTPKAVGN